MRKYSFCLIPGTFLYLHPGHLRLFHNAKKICDKVAVILSHDNRVYKKYGVRDTIEDRVFMLKSIKYVDVVIKGKPKNFWWVLDEYPIDCIITCEKETIPKEVLTYLKEKNIDVVILDCFHKEKYSTTKYV